MLHIKDFLEKIGNFMNYKKEFLKKELERDEVYEDNWEEKKNEWLPYSKADVLSTGFCYAKYTMAMENLIGFGMKNLIRIFSLAKNILTVWEMKTMNQFKHILVLGWEML